MQRMRRDCIDRRDAAAIAKKPAYPMCKHGKDLERFHFRDLHPAIRLGTASDRYAGWIGQIYTKERYEGRIRRRTNTVGGKSFIEETLPIESVEEFFQHFRVLEIDYTFYAPLFEEGNPTNIYGLLQEYKQYMKSDDRVILKIPRMISARKIHLGRSYVECETYLDAELFTQCFYEPAVAILESNLGGMIFEQEYQRKEERVPVRQMAEDLDRFFEAAPKDTRYHIELRTDAYMSSPIFDVLEKHGVGQVLSHWTWLPPLRKQLAKAGNRILNAGKQRVVRLMTPLGVRYEVAYARTHPFDKLVEEMLQPEMVRDTVDLIGRAMEEGVETSIIINNRSGGNAPLIARRIVERFLETPAP
jgi:uncharacterized protein YecE (DUF72 family)